MTRLALHGLLPLFVLLLPGCKSALVKYEAVEVPGPVRYVGIPNRYTERLELPEQALLRCTWQDRPTICNDDLRADRDALRDLVERANTDRAAVEKLSGRALKRNKDHAEGQGKAGSEEARGQ